MRHPLDIKPARMFLEGREWVPSEWAYALADALREKQRTQQSHSHQFAAIHDMWENLPHSHADAPYAKSAEAFRKHGLIATGHCDTSTVSCESHEAAMAAAPAIAELARKAHGYALVSVRGPIIVCATPHSQSYKSMGKEAFNKSKQDVLEWGEAMLGVSQ